MFLVKDQVRVVNQDNKHFGKVGIVRAIRDNGFVTVSFGGRGRPSLIKMTDLQPVVPVGDVAAQPL